MSAALYIVLENDEPGFDTQVDGKALSSAETQLDEIAKKLSVTPLMQFYSMEPDEAAEMMEESGGDSSEVNFPEIQWFGAEDGLITVRALRRYLAENADLVANVSSINADLLGFESVLKSAQEHNLKWHLAVDY
jgi:hypothetical protein